MKKLLFLAAASLTLFACDSKDESKNIQEYIEVEFMAEAPAIDMEVSVGTKAEARMIACDFPEAKGIQRLYVAENTPFKVLLPANKQVKGTFAYVKGYDEAKYWEPWAGFNAKLLYLNSSTDADAYTAVWYGYPEEYINKTIKLERKASKFTLSEGTIPEGYHLEHKTWNKAVYDWDYPGINGVLNYIDFRSVKLRGGSSWR